MSDEEADVRAEERQDAGVAAELYETFRREREAEVGAYRAYVAQPSYADHLKQAVSALSSPVTLAPGDLVQWKTFLRTAEFPAYGAPAIVVELLDPAPALDQDGMPILYPVDVLIGYLDGDQDFRVIGTDRRRLTHWEE